MHPTPYEEPGMNKTTTTPVMDEGFDEFAKRYFIISVKGLYLSPIPVEKIMSGKGDILFAALANAGL
jgi:hypothetical protein